MNYSGCEQKSAMAGGYEERERMMMMMESVVCPKPRKLRLLNPSLCEQFRPLRLSAKYVFLRDPIIVPFSQEDVLFSLAVKFFGLISFCIHLCSHHAEMADSKAGAELLDMILTRVHHFFFQQFYWLIFF